MYEHSSRRETENRTPFLSIVIPFYRTPETLFDRCVRSILSVPRADLEVLVVDDGSGDAYRSQVESFASDPRYRFVHKENAGVSAARNLGMDLALGARLMFVDSDDYVDPEVLGDLIVQSADRTEDLIVCTGCRDADGKIKYNRYPFEEGRDYAASEEDIRFLMGSALSLGKLGSCGPQYFTMGSPCSKLFRTAFLKENALRFDETVRFAEDALFMLHVYRKAASVVYRDAYLYYYVLNRGSATKRFRPGMSADMDVFFAQTEAFLRKEGLFEPLEKPFYMRAQMETKHCLTVEFLHPDNPSFDNAAFRAFVRREPYRTAIERMYIKPKTVAARLRWRLIASGRGDVIRRIGRIKKSARGIHQRIKLSLSGREE